MPCLTHTQPDSLVDKDEDEAATFIKMTFKLLFFCSGTRFVDDRPGRRRLTGACARAPFQIGLSKIDFMQGRFPDGVGGAGAGKE